MRSGERVLLLHHGKPWSQLNARSPNLHAGSSAPASRRDGLAPSCAARTAGNSAGHPTQLLPPHAGKSRPRWRALGRCWDERLAHHRLQPPRLTHPTAAATWLLVAASQRLNRQIDATKHVNVLFNLLAECGQVVTRDNRVDTR